MQEIVVIQFSKLKIENWISFCFDYLLAKAIYKSVQITNRTAWGAWEINLKLCSKLSLICQTQMCPLQTDPRSRLQGGWQFCFSGSWSETKRLEGLSIPSSDTTEKPVMCPGHINQILSFRVSTFLMLQPFNTVHVVATPNQKIILLLLHN